MAKDAILIFGVGELQRSIISRAKDKGLFVVGIDPNENASARLLVDAFEIVDGQDYEKTLFIAQKYNIKGIITAATDKPLVMMARVAEKLNLNFFSKNTAIVSTDKFLMKQAFENGKIPCAKGMLVGTIADVKHFNFPLILKPRDNSGSRGVILCDNVNVLKNALEEAKQYTKKETVLIEEFIDGKEYSIESVHWKGKTKVIQFTEKQVTPFPYNVETGHIQPADISEFDKKKIERLIDQIACVLKFDNCVSHTELKINERGIFVIETSPRLGGDYITSHLVPLSTGINVEDILIDISLGHEFDIEVIKQVYAKCAAVKFITLPQGVVQKIDKHESLNCSGVIKYSMTLHEGERVPRLVNSLSRYGEIIFQADSREQLNELMNKAECYINTHILVREQ